MKKVIKNNLLKIVTILLFSSIFLISSFSTERKRHFLIGYVGTYQGTKVWTGGYDTTMTRYPNLYEFIDLFQKKYNITDCKIMGITEYSITDRAEFWRE